MGRLDATDAEIEQAAKMANAHNFIMMCPEKYDTRVGERGAQLSGGQKQRIAIARALIRNPKILLLDEATSALDYESERVVQEALDKAKVGRTTIIIAHRLSTIKNADLIVALSGGQFQEMGKHDELMAKKGLYYTLVKSADKTNDRNVDDDDDIIKEEPMIRENDSSDDDEPKLTTIGKGLHNATIGAVHIKIDEKPIEYKKPVKETKAQQFKKQLVQYLKCNPRKIVKYEAKLFAIQKTEALWLVIGTLGQMINGVLFVVTVLLFSEVFRIFTIADPNKQNEESLKYMGILIALAFVNFAAILAYCYSFALAGARLTKRLRVMMIENLLRQEIGFHDLETNKSSILSAKLAGSVPMCKGISSDKLSLLSQGFAGVGFAVIYSFALNWKLSFVMCIFVPISFIASAFVSKFAMDTNAGGNSASEEGGRITVETVDNIKTVVSLGREEYFIKEFREAFAVTFRKELVFLHFEALVFAISNSLLFFIQCTAFAFGWHLMKNDNLQVEDLFKIYACITFSSMILGRVYAQLPDQRKSREAARTVFRIIDRKSKIDNLSEAGLKPDSVVGNIKFENIVFSYPNRPNIRILNGFSLSVKSGQTNGLVGPSGCGKSTTIGLLLRFYEAEEGTVYLDGVDIKTLNINWLRSKIGLVSQEPVLFNTTVFENICNGDITKDNVNFFLSIIIIKFGNINYVKIYGVDQSKRSGRRLCSIEYSQQNRKSSRCNKQIQ